MAQAFLLRKGGGKELTLKIVATPDAAYLPAGNDGMVAVITSTNPGNAWLTDIRPVSGMVAGDIWLQTTSGLSYALAIGLQGRAIIYPAIVYQYSGTAWVEKDAYLYTANMWVNMAYVYYNAGQKFHGVWNGSGSGNLTDYSTYFLVQCSNNANGTVSNSFCAYNNAPVDVTQFRTMRVLAAVNNSATGTWSCKMGLGNGGSLTYSKDITGTGSIATYEFDISAYVGSFVNILDTYLSESNAATNYGTAQTLRVGKHVTYGQCKALVKITSLPTLASAYTIAKAWMGLAVMPTASNTADAYLYAHEALTDWDQTTATWSNKPSCDAKHLDYTLVKKGETEAKSVQLDITNLVRKWYASGADNFGVVLDSHEDQATASFAYTWTMTRT